MWRVSNLSPHHPAGLCPWGSVPAAGSNPRPQRLGRGSAPQGLASAGGRCRRGGCQVRACSGTTKQSPWGWAKSLWRGGVPPESSASSQGGGGSCLGRSPPGCKIRQGSRRQPVRDAGCSQSVPVGNALPLWFCLGSVVPAPETGAPPALPGLPALWGQKFGEVSWASCKSHPHKPDPEAPWLFFLTTRPSLLLTWLRFTPACTHLHGEEQRLLRCRGGFAGGPSRSPRFCFAIPSHNQAGAEQLRSSAGGWPWCGMT